MENYNDLVLSYYAAVDSRNESLAEKLLAEILDVVKNDGRVLAPLRGIRFYDIEDALSDISLIILKAIRRPEVRWNPLKGASFMTWVVGILIKMIADIYKSKAKEVNIQSGDYLSADPSETSRFCGKKVIVWDDMVSPKAWNRLSPEQQYILEMKRKGEKGIKIAEDLGWDPSRVTKEKKKAISKLIKVPSDELGSFNRGDFYEIMFANVSVMVRNN